MDTILIFIEILYRSMSHELKNKSLLLFVNRFNYNEYRKPKTGLLNILKR